MKLTQEDYASQIQLANKFKIRAMVAEQLARYLNSLYVPGCAFMSNEDLRKEIDFQTQRLLELKENGIEFKEFIQELEGIPN